MHSFVVIASKRGQRVSDEVVHAVALPDLPELHFVPESHLVWASANRAIVYCGWQAFVDVAGIGSHWHVDQEGLTAFGGHVWPKGGLWSRERTWAEQLSEYWSQHDVVASYEDLFGVYAGVRLPPAGRGLVVNDPFAVGHLYYGETAEIVAVSNRASLAARAITPPDRRPARDVWTAGWLAFSGSMIGPSTGFVGVQALPLGAYVELGAADGPAIRRWSQAIWEFPDANPGVEGTESRIHLVHHELLANVRAIARLPAGNKVAHLTGGKDTRLMLSLMLAEGIQDRFSFVTLGLGDTPDVVVARRLAAAFGLDWRCDEIDLSTERFAEQVRRHVFQTSGALGAWDIKGSVEVSRDVVVSGIYGESVRMLARGVATAGSAEEVRALFATGLGFDAARLLRDDARASYQEWLNAWISEQLEAGIEPRKARAAYTLQHYRRRAGAEQEASGKLQVLPVQSLLGLRAAFREGGDGERLGRLHFEIMRRCSVPLTKLPFANDAWFPELYEHLPDAADYRAVTPYRSEGPAPTPWKMLRLEANRDVFVRYLVEDRSNPVFALLDPDRVAAAARGERPLSPRQSEMLYGALAAAIWLGHHEEAARFGAPASEPAPPSIKLTGAASDRQPPGDRPAWSAPSRAGLSGPANAAARLVERVLPRRRRREAEVVTTPADAAQGICPE